jgi:LDH2 family malate/lactate/ureidoglycolate dehydrogenase
MIGRPEVGVNEVAEALLARVRAARAGLATALDAEDAYAVAVAQDELDDAIRLARRHGLDVEATGADEG